MPARKEDWPARLAAAIAAQAAAPFAWGRRDCMLAVADVILAMTGVDPAAGWRGSYDDAPGAALALKRIAGPGVDHERLLELAVERLAADFGCPEIPPLKAGRGDVVLARIDGESLATSWSSGLARGCALAIVDTSGRRAVAAANPGWAYLAVDAGDRAWRV